MSDLYQSTRDFNVIFVHSHLDDIGLEASEFRVYGHLSRRASSGYAYPSIESMAQVCRLNHKTVRDAVSVLESKRLIKTVRVVGKSTRYYITPRSEWLKDPSQNERGSDLDPSQNERHTPPKMSGTPLPKEADEGNPSKEIQKGDPKKARQRAGVSDSDLISMMSEFSEDPQCLKAWEDWVRDRRARKKPITPIAARRQLELLTQFGVKIWLEALSKSLMNGWTGIFMPEPKLKPEANQLAEKIEIRTFT